MAILDSILKSVTSQAKRDAAKVISKAAADAVNNIGKGINRKESFTFASVPQTVEELKALPEAKMDTAYKTVALLMITLCNFEINQEETWKMLDFLNGPEEVSERDKSFIYERLIDKEYKARSFFKGATPENGYTPDRPYKIEVRENPYSFDEENWAMLYVTSSGADTERCIKLRKKPSTGQWFISDIQCLADIRIPVEQDKWA